MNTVDGEEQPVGSEWLKLRMQFHTFAICMQKGCISSKNLEKLRNYALENVVHLVRSLIANFDFYLNQAGGILELSAGDTENFGELHIDLDRTTYMYTV